MKRALLILVLCLTFIPRAWADTPAVPANEPEPATDYAAAIAKYEELIDQRGPSPDLLYNLGLAESAAGQLGPAIANLERARVLAPRDPEIRAALTEARDQAGVPAPAAAWYAKVTDLASPLEWAYLGLGGAALAALAFFLFGIWPRRRWTLTPAAFGLVVAGFAFASSYLSSRALDHAIVVKDGAVVRLSPFEGAEALFSLPAGESIAVERRQGDYEYVEAREGAAGWVRSSTVTPLAGDTRPAG